MLQYVSVVSKKSGDDDCNRCLNFRKQRFDDYDCYDDEEDKLIIN